MISASVPELSPSRSLYAETVAGHFQVESPSAKQVEQSPHNVLQPFSYEKACDFTGAEVRLSARNVTGPCTPVYCISCLCRFVKKKQKVIAETAETGQL